MTSAQRRVIIAVGAAVPVVLVAYGLYAFSGSTALVVLALGAAMIVLVVAPYLARSAWAEIQAASSIGLGIGSVVIGFGIVAYSSFFLMPQALGLGSNPLPLVFAYGTALWTYMSEIPFLLAITPPIVKAARAAFPSLRIGRKVASKKSNA